jgi:sigma-54 dependent transcriptional regulator, acetoin dehydrogenase operon transcriptional activator AcoR
MAHAPRETDPLRHPWVEKAWENFVTGKGAPDATNAFVLESWLRCRDAGVDPLVIKEPPPVSKEEARRAWQELPLAPELEPWVQELDRISADAGYLAVVADLSGRLVHIAGDRRIRSMAEHMHFVEGAPWGEQAAGTNAIGTALALGTPVQIYGAEHFVQMVHRWTCAAAPIRDPATGKPLVALDLTGFREKIHPYALELVKSVAGSVEERLRVRLQTERYLLLERYLREVGRAHADLVIAADRGGLVIRASAAALEEGFVEQDGRMSGLPLDALLRGQGAQWEAEGRRGRRRFSGQPVYEGCRVIGAVVQGESAKASGVTTQKGTTRYSFQSIIGQSPALQSAVAAARKAAESDMPILIEGQSGTGKELLVQAIHAAGHRATGPFVAVNCGAIPKELVASEFFGYEPGAFTGGAREGRAGKFQQADGGTIFLDEIGEMPLDAQVHLLRVLEEGEVIRVGGHRPVRVNVRVIAATNQDLRMAIGSGAFRADLYYRLNVISIRMPALKERTSDVRVLAQWFLAKAAAELNRQPLSLSPGAVEALEAYEWPGNIRQLRNMMYRVALLATGPGVEAADLPPEVVASLPSGQVSPTAAAAPVLEPGTVDHDLARIRSALEATHGNVVLAARQLGIHRSTIYRKLRQSSFR